MDGYTFVVSIYIILKWINEWLKLVEDEKKSFANKKGTVTQKKIEFATLQTA